MNNGNIPVGVNSTNSTSFEQKSDDGEYLKTKK